MLQIISGKFFGDGEIQEQESDGILYSNFSWIGPIQANVAELRPVDTYGSRVAAYVVRYTNRYERRPNDIMVLAAAEEALEQFRLLASFYFESFFHVDRSYVEKICRSSASHSLDRTLPSAFVPKFFDLGRTGTQPETVGFVAFIEKVIAMPRKAYRLLMTCLAGFFESLEAIGDNFDLAYSMMVYMLETLSKSVDASEPVWGDYDQNIRVQLDQPLGVIDPGAAETIRSILLSNPHLKLKKRFVSFIFDHLSDSYFTSEAEGLRFAPRKSEVKRALGNLYDARSGYVHELKQVQERLRLRVLGTDGDVINEMNDTHLTFRGLTRLARHVVMNFVANQPVLTHEEYPEWRREVPGIVSVPLAPQYWVWQTAGFQPAHARQKFSGLIEHFVTNHQLIDMRKLMEEIEKLAPSAKPSDRLPMLVLYLMYNAMVRPDGARPRWQDFLKPWEAELEQCSIELMAAHAINGHEFGWNAETCGQVYDQYEHSRHKRLATYLPRTVEIALMAHVANLHLRSGNSDQFQTWITRAILEAAGLKETQDYLDDCRQKLTKVDLRRILPLPGGSSKRALAPTEDEIRTAAYLKWDTAGRPCGEDLQFWFDAEKELAAGAAAQVTPSVEGS